MWTVLKSRWLPWSFLLATGVLLLLSRRQVNWETVARQNAVAALDSSRSISTRQGEVYARIIAQKDVELDGALATVAHLRRLHPVAKLPVVIAVGGVDTTASHPVRGVETGPDTTGPGLRDSLVLNGPPIDGVVSVAVQDSTMFWTAKLKPSPVPLTFSVGCGKDGPEFTASGPDWVETTIQPGQVDPKVCNPPGSKFWTGVKYGAGAVTVLIIAKNVLHLF